MAHILLTTTSKLSAFEIQMLLVSLGCQGYVKPSALVVSWKKEWAWDSFPSQLGKHQRGVRVHEEN